MRMSGDSLIACDDAYVADVIEVEHDQPYVPKVSEALWDARLWRNSVSGARALDSLEAWAEGEATPATSSLLPEKIFKKQATIFYPKCSIEIGKVFAPWYPSSRGKLICFTHWQSRSSSSRLRMLTRLRRSPLRLHPRANHLRARAHF